MRCANCGHELKDDEIYCIKCGKALQIVPDYNELEDEILPDLLSLHPRRSADVAEVNPSQEKTKKKNLLLRIAVILFAFVLLCVIANYSGADHTEIEAEENTEIPEEPAEETVEEEEPYMIRPAFSERGGAYTEDVVLTLTAPEDAKVYYTLDGTDPTSHNGTVFEQPFRIKNGKTTVRAACVNEEGKIGPIVEEVYSVSYQAPDMPKVYPPSGTYHEETYVTIATDVYGGSIYYTWDGSNPTMDSMPYTQPVLIPEGNHVLAIIVIDAHGMTSDILRCNYVYLP